MPISVSTISDLVEMDFLELEPLSIGDLPEFEEPPLEAVEDADDEAVDEAEDSPSLLCFFFSTFCF